MFLPFSPAWQLIWPRVYLLWDLVVWCLSCTVSRIIFKRCLVISNWVTKVKFRWRKDRFLRSKRRRYHHPTTTLSDQKKVNRWSKGALIKCLSPTILILLCKGTIFKKNKNWRENSTSNYYSFFWQLQIVQLIRNLISKTRKLDKWIQHLYLKTWECLSNLQSCGWEVEYLSTLLWYSFILFFLWEVSLAPWTSDNCFISI